MLEQLRLQLELVWLNVQDFLRDADTQEWFVLDHVQIESYMEDPDCPTTLAAAIDIFVTDTDSKDFPEDSEEYEGYGNPLLRYFDYVCEGELRDEVLFDSDMDIDVGTL